MAIFLVSWNSSSFADKEQQLSKATKALQELANSQSVIKSNRLLKKLQSLQAQEQANSQKATLIQSLIETLEQSIYIKKNENRTLAHEFDEQLIKKRVALTFDDGPHPFNTPYLLDVLKEKWAKATFYVNGNKVKKYPEIARRIVEEGHEIGNHTRNHPELTKVASSTVKRQIRETDEVIFEATGVYPTTMRPPFGSYNHHVKQYAGMPIIMRDLDTLDRRVRNASLVAKDIIHRASPEDIILLHDSHLTSAEAMREAIDGLRAKDFSFATVSELIWLDADNKNNFDGLVFPKGTKSF